MNKVCSDQHNDCADLSNKGGADFKVGDCDKQQGAISIPSLLLITLHSIDRPLSTYIITSATFPNSHDTRKARKANVAVA